MDKKVYSVTDFGAVGDGVTDDGLAIGRALQAVLEDPFEGIKELRFECERVYRVCETPPTCNKRRLFTMEKARHIHLCGCGCKLLFTGDAKLLSAHDCEDIRLSGMVIDYEPRPFILATVMRTDPENAVLELEADEDIGLTERFDPPEWWFAFPNRADIRGHYFIRRMEPLGGRRYRLTIHENTAARVREAKPGDRFLLPIIGGSHFAGSMCEILGNNGFAIENLRIYSMPEFGFDVRLNRGSCSFTNVALCPREDEEEQLVSWRDGFHIKDNLDPIVWNHCYIGPLGDDAFNLSCVYLDVTAVSADGAEIHAHPAEVGDTRALAPGDEYVAYDMAHGRELGRGRAAEVFPSDVDVHFTVDTPMPALQPGMQIAFYKYANPNYLVKDSTITGTGRVRSSGTFENCRFDVFWVRIENEFFVEGPIPRDVTFRNCTFTTPYEADAPIFHVGTIGLNGLTDCEYKCTGIRLENCVFEKGTTEIEPGNEVVICP